MDFSFLKIFQFSKYQFNLFQNYFTKYFVVLLYFKKTFVLFLKP
jgi:hypothetical protein